jgi:hypothetical protein
MSKRFRAGKYLGTKLLAADHLKFIQLRQRRAKLLGTDDHQ